MLLGHPKHPDVRSPNGKPEIHLTKKFALRVLSRGKLIETLYYDDMSCCIEVGWSPDSKQFFIMYGDGGAVGGFHVHLFRIVDNRVLTSPATRAVLKRFQRHHFCMPGVVGNNLFILDWTPNSRAVFLVAEVYPDTFCGKQMGSYEGFLADAVSGKILRRFGEKETSAIEKSCRASGTLVLPRAHASGSKSHGGHMGPIGLPAGELHQTGVFPSAHTSTAGPA